MTDWEEPDANELILSRKALVVDDLNDGDKDSVKDDWEQDSDEEREKKAAADAATAKAAAEREANKKPSEAKLAQKNRQREERVQQLLKDEAEARQKPRTAAELQAEKELQLQREREADFEFAQELVTSRVSKMTLGTHADPTTVSRVELAEMRQQILNLLALYEPNPEYDEFSHQLIVALGTRMPSDRIREVVADLNAMGMAKKKDEKEAGKKYQKSTSVVGKKGSKSLSKVNDMLDDFGGDTHAVSYGNDDEDFM